RPRPGQRLHALPAASASGRSTIAATPEGGAPMFAWLSKLDHYLPIRYAVWALCIVGLVASAAAWLQMGMSLWLVVVFAALALVGLRDVMQPRHAILRNYPVSGHLRFLLEFIRP